MGLLRLNGLWMSGLTKDECTFRRWNKINQQIKPPLPIPPSESTFIHVLKVELVTVVLSVKMGMVEPANHGEGEVEVEVEGEVEGTRMGNYIIVLELL